MGTIHRTKNRFPRKGKCSFYLFYDVNSNVRYYCIRIHGDGCDSLVPLNQSAKVSFADRGLALCFQYHNPTEGGFQ